MLCCRPPPEPKESSPLIVDLKEVLCNNAWECYQTTLSRWQKLFLKRENFTFEIPDNYFVFEDVTHEVISGKDVTADGGEGHGRNGEMKVKASKEINNKDVVALETLFGNDTPDKQTYKFRFEKTRKSVINVSFQKGFTFGGKAHFSIGLPKNIALGLEMDYHYQVTKTEGQTFEETMLMEATSDVAVGPHSRCTANVYLEEQPLHTEFKVVTRLSIPQERALVYILRKSDGAKAFIYSVKSLRQEFDERSVPCSKSVIEEGGGGVSHTKLDFVTEGVLHGTLACNHQILLKSEDPAV